MARKHLTPAKARELGIVLNRPGFDQHPPLPTWTAPVCLCIGCRVQIEDNGDPMCATCRAGFDLDLLSDFDLLEPEA